MNCKSVEVPTESTYDPVDKTDGCQLSGPEALDTTVITSKPASATCQRLSHVQDDDDVETIAEFSNKFIDGAWVTTAVTHG